ncbi:heterokaryon incompatibility protein-domain-containing protein, partial [Leptodontidium sp. 2 PMI_412]
MDNKEEADTNARLTDSIQGDLDKEALSIYGLYPPLDASKREIRLLSIYDSEDANALLSGQLQRTTLNDDYTALSYVWGDEQNRRPIRLNGVGTTITANLEMVLKQLRTEKKATKIWIDAICINQRDNTEKSHQVQMMDDIYGHANIQTILWLGEMENDSDEAMKLISTADKQFFADYDPHTPSPGLDGIKHLLKRPWWKRMWVVQEMMLSPNPI